MRRLPRKLSQRQSRIIKAVQEWFGEMNPAEKKSSVRVSLFLMARRKGIELTEEENEIAWCVRRNLASEPHPDAFWGRLTPINEQYMPTNV